MQAWLVSLKKLSICIKSCARHTRAYKTVVQDPRWNIFLKSEILPVVPSAFARLWKRRERERGSKRAREASLKASKGLRCHTSEKLIENRLFLSFRGFSLSLPPRAKKPIWEFEGNRFQRPYLFWCTCKMRFEEDL